LKPRTVRNLVLGMVALAAIFVADYFGYLPITEGGQFKNRVMYNLSKLEADSRGTSELAVLQAEIAQYQQDMQDPRSEKGEQEARFQAICLQYDRAYYARILWNQAHNPLYSAENLNQDLVVFHAAFPESQLADGFKNASANKAGKATVSREQPKVAPLGDVPPPSAPVATEAQRLKELMAEKDFLVFQMQFEQFQKDYPKSTDLTLLDDRLLELNIEYLKASHQ